MRILLVAPLDPPQPSQLKFLMGGESTYTKLLLRYPPKNITFDYFESALSRGDISYHPLQWILLFFQKLRVLPLGPRVYVLRLLKKYDLIYVHAHPIKLVGKTSPLVLSESSSNSVFLTDYLRAHPLVLRFWAQTKRLIYSLLGVMDGEVNAHQASGCFVFSRWAKRLKKSYSTINFDVIYPGLPIPKYRKKTTHTLKFLFVGVWFERKGGRLLLEAYRQLKPLYPELSLTILGEVPHDTNVKDLKDVTHHTFVSYAKLKQFYKTHDVLVHVPPSIEGYGMTVVEAMSYGMCPVVSRICALPELVEHGKNGLVVDPGSVQSLTNALTKLLKSRKLVASLGISAREKFLHKFSMPVFHRRLGTLFASIYSLHQ